MSSTNVMHFHYQPGIYILPINRLYPDVDKAMLVVKTESIFWLCPQIKILGSCPASLGNIDTDLGMILYTISYVGYWKFWPVHHLKIFQVQWIIFFFLCPYPEPLRISNSYVCKLCNKPYKTRTGWRTHVQYECNKEPQFKCPICSRRTKRKGSLKTHIFMVHKDLFLGRTTENSIQDTLSTIMGSWIQISM